MPKEANPANVSALAPTGSMKIFYTSIAVR